MTDPDLAALYQDIIIDHNRRPRNLGELPPPCHEAAGYNPLCGDRLKVYLTLDGDRIDEVKFDGDGCAISVASASLMTEALKGKTAAEAEALFSRIHTMLTGANAPAGEDVDNGGDLGKLEALGGVRAYPSRVKCATLAWHTLNSALHDDQKTKSSNAPISTE
ncbi:MAG: Fe-S cluster assembly sulfur transfer protein SufU [Propionivibrio sp.]